MLNKADDQTLSDAILETVGLPLLALDADLRVEVANEAFLRQFRVSGEETEGRLVYELGDGQWDIPELRRLLGEILTREGKVESYRVEHDFERIGRRVMLLNAKRIQRPDAGDSVLLAISDETERERLRDEIEGRIELADKLFDSVRESLVILDSDLRVRSANQPFYNLFEVDPEATEGRLIYELGNHQWDIPELRRLLEDILPSQRSFDDYTVEHEFETIGRRVMLLNGRRLDHLDEIVLAVRDITGQRAKERARAEREARQSVIVELNDRLRPLVDPVAIEAAAAEILARRLGADLVVYSEIDESGEHAIVVRAGNEKAMALEERYRMRDFGEVFVAELRRGLTVAVEDVSQDPRAARAKAGAFESVSVSAFLSVPLVKEGRLTAVLSVHSREPRAWSAPEASMVEEVAARTWSAVVRARAESALRESERRYRLLFDSIDQGFCVIELIFDDAGAPVDYRFLAVNAAFARQTGLADVIGKTMRSLESETEDRWFETYGRIAVTRQAERFEGPAEKLGRYYEVYAFPFGAAEERTIGVLFNNITERQAAEAALRESERRLAGELEDAHLLQRISTQLVSDQAPDALYAQVVDAARALMRSDAASIQEYVADSGKLRLLAQAGLHPDSASFWEWVDTGAGSACGRALEAGARIVIPDVGAMQAAPEDIAAYRRSGLSAVQSTPLLTGDKRIVGMLSTHWRKPFEPSVEALRRFDVLARMAADLIERTEAAAALRASEARYRMLFNSIDEGFAILEMIYDDQGEPTDYRFIEVNPMFETSTGLADAVGRTVYELVPELEPGWVESFGMVARTGEPARFTRDAKALGKTYDIFAFPIGGSEDGRVAVLSRDVTERKRAEEQRSLLLREVNHRSKNILSLVQAIARMTAGGEGQDFARKFEQRIRALSASQDLLVNADWKGVDLDRLARSQLAHFEDLLDDRITLSGPSVAVTATASQTLGMALHELATNAGKYGALSVPDGRVAIDWRFAGEPGKRRLVMSWRESGGPVVEPPRRPGFGSIVMRDMARMNLKAKVDLSYPQTGVVWRLDCPVEHCVEGRADLDGEARPTGGRSRRVVNAHEGVRGKVLVVEDEALMALELAEILTGAGHEVIGPVGTVDQALALLDETRCDAALLDVNLGDETAEPVARKLADERTPFIVVSGYNRSQLPAAFREAKLLTKPVERNVLVAELGRCLASAAAEER